MCQAAKAAAVLAALIAPVLLPFSVLTPVGAAAGDARLTATIDGAPVGASTEARPLRLSPRREATLAVEVTNNTSRPLDIRIVRLEGKVVGLTFFAYDTAVGLKVSPGETGSRRFLLDLGGLDGQATGLIPGAVKVLDTDRRVVAEQRGVVDVRGSWRSVYGIFGLGVAFLTLLSFLGALVGLARHRLPPNRWRRALRFLTPGLGLGLLLNFTLSATRVFVPTPGRWLTIVVVSAGVLFGLGYLTPAPDTGEEDEEYEDVLVALPAPPVEPELPAGPAWPELATPGGMVALPAEPVVGELPVAAPEPAAPAVRSELATPDGSELVPASATVATTGPAIELGPIDEPVPAVELGQAAEVAAPDAAAEPEQPAPPTVAVPPVAAVESVTLDRERVTAALPAYEVGAELGRGGWGVVLEGRHRQLGREVAIKQLPRAFAADPAVRDRFTAEARLLASLDHPHIVPVYDYVESDGLCLLVMEKLPGGTVWTRFTSTGVTAEAACGLVLATAAGLHAAHQRGILHRDVKPENLMFSAGGALKVTDFGIAKVVGGAETMATRVGEVLGTPAYMAPEQAQAAELGPPTDVYAVGVMLYELLSGRLPFPDEGDAMAILYQHVHEQPTPLTDVAPGVPAGVAAVVMRALATRADQRYPTAEAFGVALAEAATSAWGPGWPAGRGQVSVMGSTLIVAATERQSVPAAGLVVAAGSVAPATVVVAPSAPVRATVTTRRGQARPADDDSVVLVAVRQMVERPPFPTRLVAWTAGLLFACLVLGLLGLGSPGRGGDLPRGSVRVAGRDPAAGVVTLDLADVVTVEGRLPGGVPDRVRLALSMGGIGVGAASGITEVGPDGSFRAVVDLAGSRYLAAGRTTATVDLLSGGRTVASRSFAVQSTRPGLLSLPGAIGVAAALFLMAYAESVLRLLRRGRRRRTGVATLVLLGGPLGCALALVAALMAGREPALVTMVLAGLVGGGAGLAAGRAGVSVGRFRRLARAKISR